MAGNSFYAAEASMDFEDAQERGIDHSDHGI